MEDPIIKLNARGQFIEVRKSVLLNMRYFQCLLGDGPFKSSSPREDGSYYLDVDRDLFREILSYVEFGTFRSSRFKPEILSAVLNKLGVEHEHVQKESLNDRTRRLRNCFQSSFLKEIETHRVNKTITIEFMSGDEDSFKYLNGKLVVIYSMLHYKFIRGLLKSDSLALEFFSKLGPIISLQLPTRFNDREISINFE